MKKIARFGDRCIQHLEDWASLAAAVVVIGLMVEITLHVMLRYAFAAPLVFTKEYSGYAFVFIVYMGFARCVRRGANVRVDLLVRRLPERARDGLELATLLAALILICIFVRGCFYAFIECLTMERKSGTSLMTPLWIPYVPMWVGGCLLVLSTAADLVRKSIAFHRKLEGSAEMQ